MKATLDIAFFGSSLVSAFWNGAATYYRGILRALAARGHRITFYEPDAYDRQAHRDIPDPEWATVVVYPIDDAASVLATVARARKADLIVKASGVGVHDALLEEAVLNLKTPRNLVVFWDVDAPATLERLEGNPSDSFRPLIPQYDLILTYGGGTPVINAYEEHGARQCVPIYNALDPDTHYPVAAETRFSADLAFLGNRLPDRESRVEEFFLRAAEQAPQRQFLLGGSGWGERRLPQNVRYAGHVYTRDHNAFNCSPLAVLNINRSSMARYGFSPPTRIFEAAGAAACLITDAWEGIELFLEPGKEVLLTQDGTDVARQLDSLDPARAKAIGFAARRRVLREHTYTDRVAQLETLLGVPRAHPARPVEVLIP
jgi:spore maturation protein CgeB